MERAVVVTVPAAQVTRARPAIPARAVTPATRTARSYTLLATLVFRTPAGTEAHVLVQEPVLGQATGIHRITVRHVLDTGILRPVATLAYPAGAALIATPSCSATELPVPMTDSSVTERNPVIRQTVSVFI